MKAPTYLGLFLLGLIIFLIGAQFQTVPGYMDAEYYYAGGVRLVEGKGFTEEILWNYLDDPQGIPHPSHNYWMPLISILSAFGMWVFGQSQFSTARGFFILVAAALPVVTAALSYSLTGKRGMAIVAGILATFPGFYLPYLTTTDAFSVYMLFGGLFLLLMRNSWDGVSLSYPPVASFLLGLLAGLMHLTRVDGVLWFFLALLVIWLQARKIIQPGRLFILFGLCVFGYLLVMGPWMARNYMTLGVLTAPGGVRTLWLTSYDELFIYPADLLTFGRWWAYGLRHILSDRIWAAGQNFQTVLAVQGEIILLPLILVGIWHTRDDRRIQVSIFAWLLTLIFMTMVFPYAGARGGFFHSGAALQPVWWSVTPLGLVVAVRWLAGLRGWNLRQAERFFQVGLIGVVLMVSGLIYYQRVIGSGLTHANWEANDARYIKLENVLSEFGADDQSIVMVNDSPGYYVASGRPAISIPYGDLGTVLAVAERYGAQYLLLEIDQINGDDDLYQNPGDRPGITYLGAVDGTHIYMFGNP